MKKRKTIVDFYTPRVSGNRESHEIVDWGSRDAQIARFSVLVRILHEIRPAATFSVLDVGCGLADLEPHVRNDFPDFTYTGVDLTLAVLIETERRRPGLRLVNADILHALPFRPQSFDFLFCSGVFNLAMGDNERIVNESLPFLMSYAKIGLMVNFLHTRAEYHYPYCHYYRPDRVIETANTIPGSVTCCIDDYLDNDFTLWIRKTQDTFAEDRSKYQKT